MAKTAPCDKLRCPKCGHPFEVIVSVKNPKRRSPPVGAHIICEECFEMAVLTDFGRSIRRATLTEVKACYTKHIVRAVRCWRAAP